MTLLAVGSIAFDDLETPFGKREDILGGSATYFALSGCRFCPVQVVAVVGEDFGPDQEKVFRGRPIDLGGLVRKPGKCFRWKGAYGFDLNEAKTLETHLNVFAHFQPVIPDSYLNTPHVFLGNIDPVLQLEVLRQLPGVPKWVALDTMNYWIQGSRKALEEVLAKVDILLMNEAEVREFTGEHSLIKAYRRVQVVGPQVLVVKRGEYGVCLLTPEGVFAAPAYPLEDVFDPTGAGDTFAGGFLGFLASKGRTDIPALKKAALTGSIMASFTVERFGTERLETITEKDILHRMKGFSDMIRVEEL